MEDDFDVNNIYTAVNAEEVKIGSRVVGADNMCELKYKLVLSNIFKELGTIENIRPDFCSHRFLVRYKEQDNILVNNALVYMLKSNDGGKTK